MTFSTYVPFLLASAPISDPRMTGMISMTYLIAAGLFIMSLGGLSQQKTARKGNLFGIIGITIAIGATLLLLNPEGFRWIIPAVVIGGAIGLYLAVKVEMTSMPELVAILHSFVGLAAVLVGISSYLTSEDLEGVNKIIHEVEIFLGVFIGAITFTGSVIAFGKLRGMIGSKPLCLPGRHLLNLGMLLVSVYLGYRFMQTTDHAGMTELVIMTLLAFILGAHLVMAIGGADMPVVVSMLNSYSGWAAAATGFMLSNDLLIVTGALVGSSGAILSYIMCKAMNRSIVNVLFGGFGSDGGAPTAGDSEIEGEITSVSAEETAQRLKDAKEVVIIPGYGMAVAQAQHPVYEITKLLRDQGTNVRFAIHPVAGRLPGHMNVLLAEAKVPYDIVLEMDEINEDFPKTDIVLIIGANDIVNPAAQDNPGSPIYGMPVLEAWKSKNTIVLKRSMGTGYSGVENPLFYKDNTDMLFGDAKASVEAVLASLK
jgi:NAD(P) transhydrogenase subunit beta